MLIGDYIMRLTGLDQFSPPFSRGAQSAMFSTGVKTLTVTGAKEMLRFNFSISGGSSPGVYDTFYINVLAPVWRP